MNKYKVMGLINLIFGIMLLIISPIFPSFIIPGLGEMYEGMEIDLQLPLIGVYVATALIFVSAIINLFVGIKGITKNNNKDKYFNYGIIAALISFFLPGVLAVILNFSVIYPIYNITSQI
jgi:membrane protein implicated in regulation of membrane protease activity